MADLVSIGMLYSTNNYWTQQIQNLNSAINQ